MFEEQSGLIAKYEDFKKDFLDKMKSSFGNIFEEFFRVTPHVNIVGWTQYTPHFNDGDPCEFSVHEFFAAYVDLEEDEITSPNDLEDLGTPFPSEPSEWEREFAIKEDYFPYKKKIAIWDDFIKNPDQELVQSSKNWDSLNKFLSSIPDEVFLDAFGDNAFVKVTRENGIEVIEHEHD